MRVLLVVVAALVFAGSASADTTFTDPSGETAGSADVSTIVVSNDPTAHTFKLTVLTNMPAFEPNSEIDVLFDADNNATTGEQGFDYLFLADSTGAGFGKWDGTQWVDTAAPGGTYQFANGLLTVQFAETDLGLAVGKTFGFGVLTFRGPDPANPIIDGAGPFSYTLAAPPPPPPPPPPPAKPTVKSTTVTATVPRAGAAFHVGPFEVNLSDGTVVSTTHLKCTATIAGVKVHGTGAGGCTFKLPKTAHKKRIVVHVSGTYGGATISKNVTYVIK